MIEYKLEVDQYTEEIVTVPVNILSNENIKYNYYPKELSVKYFISIDDYKKTTPIDFRIECVLDKQEKIPAPEMTKAILEEALNQRLIVLSCGVHQNAIRLSPPLIISEDDLIKGLNILIKVIHDYH